jgi:polygalacturonase
MNTIFNIIDYGAKGDNLTDNTIAIQKAIDDAAKCMGKVIVPPGIYKTSKLKLSGKGIIIEGSASWSYRGFGGSILSLNDSNVDSLIDITGSFGCAIINLNLCGNNLGTNIHGIKLKWDKYNGGSEEDTPKIDGCKIANFSGDGIYFKHVWCFSIRHSMLAYNKGNGLFIDGWDGFILDNWFSYNEGYGLLGGNVVASISATGNRVEWNKLGGFKIEFGDSFNFTGNFFDRGEGPSISLGGSKSVSLCTITGNIFRRAGASNNLKDKFDSSHLRLTNCTNITVTSNTMRVGRNDGGGGILSPNYGFVIRNCTNCIISNNTMEKACLKELLVLENNSNCVIENNIGSITDESYSTGSELLN